MQPGYGTPTLLGYGNGASSGGSLPSIDNRVYASAPMSQMGAPTLNKIGRMPILERVTPRRINATKTFTDTAAQARVRVVTVLQRVARTGRGYANVTRTRFFQDIGPAPIYDRR